MSSPIQREICRFFDNADNFVNRAVDTAIQKYHQIENAAPKAIEIAKKILPFALVLLSLVFNPISTLVGLGIGVIASTQLGPVIEKIGRSLVDSFNDSSLFGKILMSAGAIAIGTMVPGCIQGAAVGVTSGVYVRKTVDELINKFKN